MTHIAGLSLCIINNVYLTRENDLFIIILPLLFPLQVLKPSHNPPSDNLESTQAIAERTQIPTTAPWSLTQDGITPLPASSVISQATVMQQVTSPTTADKAGNFLLQGGTFKNKAVEKCRLLLRQIALLRCPDSANTERNVGGAGHF